MSRRWVRAVGLLILCSGAGSVGCRHGGSGPLTAPAEGVDLQLRARQLELEAPPDVAFAAWLRAPRGAWSAARIEALVESHPTDGRLLDRLLDGGPDLALAAEGAAIAQGRPEGVLAARALRGALTRYERSGRLTAPPHHPRTRGWPDPLPRPATWEPIEHAGGHVHTLAEGPGFYAFRLGLDAFPAYDPTEPPEDWQLEIHGEGPWRLYAGKDLLHSHDPHLSPGPRRVFVRLPAALLGAGDHLFLFVRALDVQRSVRVFATPARVAPKPSGPEHPLAEADLALRHGPHGPPPAAPPGDIVALAIALESALADPGRDLTRRADAALACLEGFGPGPRPAGIARLAARAHLLLGDGDAAHALLPGTPIEDGGTPTSQTGDDLRLSLELADLEEDLPTLWKVARPLLLAGPPHHPPEDRLLALELVRARGQTRALVPDALTSLPAPGPAGRLQIVLAEEAVARGQDDKALALLDMLIGGPPGHPELGVTTGPTGGQALLLRGRLVLARGDLASARQDLARATRELGPRSGAASLEAQLRRLDGDPAAARSEPIAIQRRLLGAPARRRAIPQQPEGETAPTVTDARVLLREALSRPLSDYFEVILEERVDLPMSTGAIISRRHRIFCTHSPDATGRFGEVPLPREATLVLARTWKVHRGGGGLLLQPIDADPDLAADLGAISMPSLEPGDCAELLWLEREERGRQLIPSPRRHRFTFDADDGPTHLARWTWLPGEAPAPHLVARPSGRSDLRPWAGGAGRGLEAGPLAAARPEPGDPRADLRRHFIDVMSNEVADMLPIPARLPHETLAEGAMPSPRVVDFALEAAAAAEGRDLVEELRRAVLARVSVDTDPLAANAVEAALEEGEGSRAALFWAAARALGLRAELVFARPASEGGPEARDDEAEAFSYPLVMVDEAEARRWVDPDLPTDILQPTLRKVAAVALDAGGALRRIETPDSELGRRQVTVVLRLDPEARRFSGRVREQLSGVFARAWREVIARVPAVNRDRLMSHVATGVFPAARVSDHDLRGLEPTDPALEWDYAVNGSLDPLSPERIALTMHLAADNPLGGLGSIARRTAPFFFNQTARLEVELTVEIPAGWRLVATPPDSVRTAAGFRHSLHALVADRPGGGEKVIVRRTYTTDPAWIPVSELPRWASVGQGVLGDNRLHLELIRSYGPRPDGAALSEDEDSSGAGAP